jgi:hypothetical protein
MAAQPIKDLNRNDVTSRSQQLGCPKRTRRFGRELFQQLIIEHVFSVPRRIFDPRERRSLNASAAVESEDASWLPPAVARDLGRRFVADEQHAAHLAVMTPA